MQGQSIRERLSKSFLDQLPNLPLLRCSRCGKGLLRAATYGIISLVCHHCRVNTIFLDGGPVLTRRKAVRFDAADPYLEPDVDEVVKRVEEQWERRTRARSTVAIVVGVGLRFDVFVRDGFACRYCGRAATDGAVLEVDHVHPRALGGRDEMNNLVTACWECNRGKSAKVLAGPPPIA